MTKTNHVLFAMVVSTLWAVSVVAQEEIDERMTFFVTSTSHSGDLGGLAGADAECQRLATACLLYTSPSPRDGLLSRMPSSA